MNHRLIQVGKSPRRSLVQLATQSRISPEVSSGCSGFDSVRSWKSPRLKEAMQPVPLLDCHQSKRSFSCFQWDLPHFSLCLLSLTLLTGTSVTMSSCSIYHKNCWVPWITIPSPRWTRLSLSLQDACTPAPVPAVLAVLHRACCINNAFLYCSRDLKPDTGS